MQTFFELNPELGVIGTPNTIIWGTNHNIVVDINEDSLHNGRAEALFTSPSQFYSIGNWKISSANINWQWNNSSINITFFYVENGKSEGINHTIYFNTGSNAGKVSAIDVCQARLQYALEQLVPILRSHPNPQSYYMWKAYPNGNPNEARLKQELDKASKKIIELEQANRKLTDIIREIHVLSCKTVSD